MAALSSSFSQVYRLSPSMFLSLRCLIVLAFTVPSNHSLRANIFSVCAGVYVCIYVDMHLCWYASTVCGYVCVCSYVYVCVCVYVCGSHSVQRQQRLHVFLFTLDLVRSLQNSWFYHRLRPGEHETNMAAVRDGHWPGNRHQLTLLKQGLLSWWNV